MISVIIPALNEPYLQTLKKDIAECLGSRHYEILVQEEIGLSNAVLKGIENSCGQIIVVMDGDGSHNPKYILPMVEMINENIKVVFGCRQSSFEPFHRKIINKLMASIVRLFLGIRISDPLTGFIAGKRECFKFSERKGFKFGLEILFNNKYHVSEIPITFEKRKGGKSKANPLQVVRIIKQIWRMREWTREQPQLWDS